MRRRGDQLIGVVALAVCLLAGCKTAGERIAEGERLTAGGKYDEALDCYRDALTREDLNAVDKERALKGRGQALLAKNDLVSAEAAFNSLPPSSSSRPALLGHVAYLRRDTHGAEKLYREAYGRGERGLVTTRLAEVVGGEAQTPARLLEAAKILKDGGGELTVAQGLEEAAQVWQAAEQNTGTPAGLLAKLDRAKEQARTYVALELIRASLLTRSGQGDKATAVYLAMTSFDPRPSEGFLQFIREQQMHEAVFTGDTAGINRMVDAGMLPPEQAAKVRADIARGYESSGCFVEALEQWQRTAQAGGTPSGRAWCEVARLEALRGRAVEANDAWLKASATSEPDATTRVLVALAQARGLDPLGARRPLERAASDASLDAETRDDAARFARAIARLEDALELVASGSVPRARSLCRSAVALAPELSLAVALDLALGLLEKNEPARFASALDAAGATGATRDAFLDARTGRLLVAGLFDEAIKPAQDDKLQASVLAAIGRRAPAVLARLTATNKIEDAIAFVEKLKAAKLDEASADLLGRLRGDATFASLWGWKRFTDAAGKPDPLARRAPYCCELTLASGTSLGVVKVTAATPAELVARVPGRARAITIAADKLAPVSLRGVDDEVFERAERAARELGERRPAGAEGGE